MKISIVHDYLNQYGGAEKVIEAIHETFPGAPIFTSIYLSDNMPDCFRDMDIRTSLMQKFPFLHKHFKKYFLLYPLAFKSFNLDGYDIILSSSSAYAKGIKVPKGSMHICYCHTPARFIWRYDEYIRREIIPKFIKMIISYLASSLRYWDIDTTKAVNFFITNSENVKQRIKIIYGKDSEIIYPPVEINKLVISNQIEDYFLVVSRLNAYKMIDVVIDAFNEINKPLRIIGDGPYG